MSARFIRAALLSCRNRAFSRTRVFSHTICVLLLVCSVFRSSTRADDDRGFRFELGHEYSEYNKPAKGAAESSSFGRRALLYLPNRLLDLLDIFKLDLGLGVGYGAVMRPSKPLQFGYRKIEPGMVRVGLMGRRAPVMFESRTESGFGDDYRENPRREVSTGEFGVGVDLGIVGAYAGLGVDSLGDFVLGLAGIDLEDDDYH